MNKKFKQGYIAILYCLLAYIPMVQADIALPDIGDSAGALISPQQEYRIGQGFFWRLQQSVDLVDDPEVTHYLTELGQHLVSYSDAPALPFRFFVVPDPRINAFAAPGGFIGVNSGLFLASQQEDELASVLAHEVAHVTQRHILRSIEKQQQLSVPSMMALVGAMLLGVADPQAGMAALTIVQAGGVQAQINHTRAHEAEADNIGMLNLVRAGFEAQAMPLFFERMQARSRFYSGQSIPEFLRTHPVTSSRIAEARGRAVRYPRVKSVRDPTNFYLIREKLRVALSYNLTELKAYYHHAIEKKADKEDMVLQYGRGLALLKAGEYHPARQVMTALTERYPHRLAFQLALADIAQAAGKRADAFAIYQANAPLYPTNYALNIGFAKILMQMEQAKQAEQILLTQLQAGYQTTLVYQLLAKSQDIIGNESEAHRWLAEYYYHAGQLDAAMTQLTLSIAAAGDDRYQLAMLEARQEQVKAAQSAINANE